MANSPRKGMKRSLLLGFVAICIILIAVIWVEGLTVSEPTTPSYYRDSYQVDEPVDLIITAEARGSERHLDGTPENHRHSQGWGQRRDDSLDY